MNAHDKSADLGLILDEELVKALPGVLRAVLLSRDGLVVTTSEGVERDLADTMAAAASGLLSLSREGAAFADCSDSPLELTLIQYGDGYLVGMAAGADTIWWWPPAGRPTSGPCPTPRRRRLTGSAA